MKKTPYTEDQIVFELRQVKAGTSLAAIRRKLSVIVSAWLVRIAPSAGSLVGE